MMALYIHCHYEINLAAIYKESSTSSKSYALVSVLPQELKNRGLIEWGKSGSMLIGLLATILSLIYVNGRVLSEGLLLFFFYLFCYNEDYTDFL